MTKSNIEALAKENAFDLIGKQWMLVTAGTEEKFNTMTVSWGGIGWLWNRAVAFIFIRPERYTYEFIEAQERLTLSVLPEEYRKALQLCGSKSGRDMNKVEAAGLHPVKTEAGTIGFEEARLTLSCRKLFRTEMEECNFLDKDILSRWYNDQPGGSFHAVYVLEIEDVYEGDK